tara:strand:+ start:218 stop:466 length:249 start_codon:yes stop_codon:yes gene_type:complete
VVVLVHRTELLVLTVVLEVEEVLLIILHIMVEVVHQAKVMMEEEVDTTLAVAVAVAEAVLPHKELLHLDQMDLKQVVLVVLV